MDKRLLKRHKRQVTRAKDRLRISEPDLRTPDEIKAAREASRAAEGGSTGAGRNNSALGFRGRSVPVTGGASKTDA